MITTGRLLGGLALLVPLVSALTAPAVPVPLRLLLVVFLVTALVRPHGALVALAVLVPFASWLLLVLDVPPVRYAEALVLATLSGGIMASGRPRLTPLEGQRPSLAAPALLFCMVVGASAAVMLQVMQAGTHASWPLVRGFFVFLTRDYLVSPPGSFPGVADAALLVEGVAIVFVAARHARDGVVRPAEIFAATAIGGAAAALLSIASLVAQATSAASFAGLVRALVFSRTSGHVSDVNAAGSFFAMAGFLAVALALNRRHTRVPRSPAAGRALWFGAATLLFAGVWLTGSRMAVVASVGTLVVTAATAWRPGPQRWPRWAVAPAAVTAALVLAALAVGLDPRPSAARTALHMFNMRADFMLTGLRMIASAPVFGVGVGRYFEMSGSFMPASIYWFYFHENAHNNLLQIGGELGLVGLAAFVWLLAAAAIRIQRGLRADPGDRLLMGASAGLGALVVTWMTSHPMLVHEVAYPFWILLGAALARADGDAHTFSKAAQPFRAARAANASLAIAVIALFASVPLRARREVARPDFTKQSFGFYGWETEGGQRFRWTSRRAAFFIPPAARELHLSLRARHLGTNRAPTEVSIAVGGRTFHRTVLADDNWMTVRLSLPRPIDDEGFQRIDIITEPTWSPAALFGSRNDMRVLGVQVGEAVTEP